MIRRILIINAVVWLLTVLLRRLNLSDVFEMLALTPSDVFPGFQVWQLFTYMWLHSTTDFLHILFNSLFLWMFGSSLEQSWGSRVFLKFYILCGLWAGVAVLLIGAVTTPHVATVGASGAIYGLVAAWAILFPNQIVYIFGVFPMRGRYFALIPIGYAVLDFITGSDSGVSHAAHLGGLLAGVVLVTGFWRPGRILSKVRYVWRSRRFRVIDGERRQPPPGGGYWN